MSELFELKIQIEGERYYNDDSNYGVYVFTTKDDVPELTEYVSPFEDAWSSNKKMGNLVGKMQKLYIGSEYGVKAKLEFNKKYKTYQYVPVIVSALTPSTIEDQKKFLEALVSPRQSEILINAYPNIVNDVVGGLEEIDYSKTKGIREATWERIKQAILDNYIISDILVMLQPLGISYAMIKKIIKDEPNPELLKKNLIEDPYILTKINGLGFKRVDDIALKLNPDMRISTRRTYAFIKHFLEQIGNNEGHTWVMMDSLENAVRDNINECIDIYKKIIEVESNSKIGLLHIDDKKVGLKYFYETEMGCFRILEELDGLDKTYNVDVEKGIENAENDQGFELTDEQKSVIIASVNQNVVVLSGRAGTGKSSSLRTLLKIYQTANCSIACAALSAKAAQRIQEATGFPASTIHRLLKARGVYDFEYNKDNPLPHDIIAIDECSMINAHLFHMLLMAIKPGAKVILCGDDKQLPPIGFGNIFSDLLDMDDCFNVKKLTKVMRQAEKSGILTDANMIRENVNPVEQPELKLVHGELQDMYYMFRDSREALQNIAIKRYMDSIEQDGLDETVILTPRKKDCLNSTFEINLIIQDMLIDDFIPSVVYGKMKFKEGAKVIQRENDYNKNVFNGEIGYIKKIYKDDNKDYIDIEFPDKVLVYKRDELSQIDLAYAMTTHLSQGSGYKTIIGIVDNTHYTLLSSCMLYTLLTRAKKRALLLSEPSAFKKCIMTNGARRNTWLNEFNKNKFKDVDTF